MASHTRNRWTQDTPNPDGQIPVGIAQWGWVTTVPSIADAVIGDGKPYYALTTNGATYNGMCADLTSIIRTGVLATPSLTQEQFGTKALQPGPSAVSGTSGPLALSGYPPYTNAQNPIYGGVAGATKKGFQINWIDLIYSTGANAVTSVSFGLAATNFVNNTAPNVQNVIAYGTNSLPVAAQANPYVARINVATPTFYTLTDTFITATVQFVMGATATAAFYGCVLGVSFNLN